MNTGTQNVTTNRLVTDIVRHLFYGVSCNNVRTYFIKWALYFIKSARSVRVNDVMQ